MKKLLVFVFVSVQLVGCYEEDRLGEEALVSDGKYASTSSVVGPGSGQPSGDAGVITAGEWNDQNNWNFWMTLMSGEDYGKMPERWNFFPLRRISLHVVDNGGGYLPDVPVELRKGTSLVYSSKTDNKGNAELWVNLFQDEEATDLSQYNVVLNGGSKILANVLSYEQGINEVVLPVTAPAQDRIEISFVVDATGSMSDELEFLKDELSDVITRARTARPSSTIALSSVFYRDAGDEYVTRVLNFSTNAQKTIDFIKAQSAGGGGDFPEAVHSAMDKAVNELQWSSSARTRLIFLLLDAPPHDEALASLQSSVSQASSKGIKIIPIVASGIDKDTEFLMRFTALSTNGTYVFITNDSGIGGDHIEASVGEYEVEFLNDLMVRLISQYSE